MILFRMPWQRTCQRFIWLAFLSFMGSVSSIAYGFFFTHCSDYLGDRIKLVNSEKPSNIIATKSNSFDRYSPGSPLVSTKAAKYARRSVPGLSPCVQDGGKFTTWKDSGLCIFVNNSINVRSPPFQMEKRQTLAWRASNGNVFLIRKAKREY